MGRAQVVGEGLRRTRRGGSAGRDRPHTSLGPRSLRRYDRLL